MSDSKANSFVLFPMGERRFALPSQFVTELARPDHLQTFPHTTPLLVGVLVRRGHVIPVCDVAEVLVGPDAPARKFFLIAMRAAGQGEWLAIPVTGECELAKADLEAQPKGCPAFVTGLLTIRGEAIQVVDLERLISDHSYKQTALRARSAEVSA